MLKRVFITGVAGFIGSHLAAHHIAQGDYVSGIDNFVSSNELSEHHQENIKNGLDFKYEDVAALQLDKYDYSIIYNMACPASPPIYQSMPIQTMMTCVNGTKNVLDYAWHFGAIVVHASTSEIYGDATITPQVETYRGNVNSYGPRACYDEGKRAAEALCYDYRTRFSVDARVVRIFNTYGPHMDPNDGRVVSNFINQALSNNKLTIYGDGKQTRSFCYIDDTVKALVAMASLKLPPNTPINIGNPKEFSMNELAQHVMTKTGNKSGIVHRPLPVDDPTHRCPDITLAQNVLDWWPQVSLSEGLDKTIEYFRRIRS